MNLVEKLLFVCYSISLLQFSSGRNMPEMPEYSGEEFLPDRNMVPEMPEMPEYSGDELLPERNMVPEMPEIPEYSGEEFLPPQRNMPEYSGEEFLPN